jgi:hypothetical protein
MDDLQVILIASADGGFFYDAPVERYSRHRSHSAADYDHPFSFPVHPSSPVTAAIFSGAFRP